MDEKIKGQFLSAYSTVNQFGIERSTIGTLGEKSLHLILKYTFEPDCECHEVKVGRYFADIKNEYGITEIHTGSFNTLRKKLDAFLACGNVRIVYPIAERKQIVWINVESGEVTSPRKSPKTGRYCHCFRELYKIKQYLGREGLTFTPVLMNITEYRKLDGWSADRKKGSNRFERIPTDIIDYVDITNKEDYGILLPDNLPQYFTVKEFAKSTKLSQRAASDAISVLKHLDIIELQGKKGRAYHYCLTKNE